MIDTDIDLINAVSVPIIITSDLGYVEKYNETAADLLPEIGSQGSYIWQTAINRHERDQIMALCQNSHSPALPATVTATHITTNGSQRVNWTARWLHSTKQYVWTGSLVDTPVPTPSSRVFEKSSLLTWVVLPDNSCIDFNERAREKTGCDQAHPGDFIHAEDIDRRQMVIDEARRHGTSYTVEVRIKLQDQGYHWIQEFGQPLTPSGDWSDYLAVGIDNNDVRQALFEMQREKMQLSAVMQSLGDAVVTMDAEGRVVQWNTVAHEIFGYQPYDIIGKPVEQLLPADAHDEYQAIVATARDASARPIMPDSVTFELTCLREDGQEFPAEISMSVWSAVGDTFTTLIIRDITRRRAMNDTMRQLARAVENSPASVVITDTRGDIEWVNPKFIELTGYSFHEVLGKNPSILKSGETPDVVYAQMWKQISAGETWRGEFHNRKKNGEFYWELAAISPVLDEYGNITHYVAVKEDITDRKEMEAALKRSEAHLQRIIQTNLDGMMVIDTTGRVRFKNSAAQVLLDKLDDELASTPYETLLGNVNDYDMHTFSLEAKDGSPIFIEVRAARIEWEGDSAHLVSLRDITARVEAQQALVQSEANLRALLDSSDIAFTLINHERQILMVNTLARQYGLVMHDHEPQPGDNIRDHIPSDKGETFERYIASALAGESAIDEWSFESGDRRLSFEFRFQPVTEADGQVLGAYISSEDITERREAEQQALSLEVERQRRRILSGFVRDASHEFRTPLTIIGTSVALIERIDDRRRRMEKVDQIQSQIDRIRRLLDDLLLITNLDTIGIEVERADLNTIMRQTASNWRIPYEEAGVELKVDLAPEALVGRFAVELMGDAIDRLLDNSLRFTPRGCTVHFQLRPDHDRAVITVRDEGEGIDPVILNRIQDQFFRGDEAHTTSGFGLGLPITVRVVDLHGGDMAIESRLGEGTIVTVRLPLSE